MGGSAQVHETGRSGLQRLRESIGERLSDFTPLTSEGEFGMESSVRHLGAAVLFENRMTAAHIDRSWRHVARGDHDHYQVRFVIEGAYRSVCRRRSVEILPGSIHVSDMTEAEQVDILPPEGGGVCRSVVFYFPRHFVAPSLAQPDDVGAILVPGGTAYGAFLHAHFVALARAAPHLTPAELEATVPAAALLVAAGIGAGTDRAGPLARADRDARLAAIKRYVRSHLEDDLDVAAIAARFGMSRASLYRLFEPDGGVAHYARRCRLEHAFAVLSSKARARVRIVDLALDCRFESESSFVRAFRRRFKITPGALQRLSHPLRDTATQRARGLASGADVHDWLETLTGATRASG